MEERAPQPAVPAASAAPEPREFILQGSLLRAVFRIAWPASAAQLLFFANNFVDYLWVKGIGKEAAAGQTAGWTVFWMLAALAQIFQTGLTAVVARRLGERRDAQARHAATHGLRGALLFSLLVALLGALFAPALVGGEAASAAAAKYTSDYLVTIFLGAPFVFLLYAAAGVFRGHGDTRRPLVALVVAVSLNMLLDPLLIVVLHLEVLGAALATVAAFAVSGLLLARAGATRRYFDLTAPGFDTRLNRKILRIGTPISLHGITFSLVYVFLIFLVNRYGGDAATAALGLGLRLEGFSYMTAVGCATAASAIVGQSLGAGSFARANRGAWIAAGISVAVSLLWGVFLFFLPARAVGLLSPGPQTTAFTVEYFRIVAASLAFSALEITVEGAFSGAGDTLPPLLLSLPYTLGRIPLAYLAAATLGLGVAGVFWAVSLTSIARGLTMAYWFRRGRWMHARA